MRPNPLTPMTAFAAALLAGLAGYYIGKSSGMRHSETITTLKEIAKSSPARDDDFRPPGGSLSSSVVDLGKGGGEEEEQESSDEEEDGEGVKEFEESRENNLKMVFLVRTDLGMTKGKIAAQCGHATLSCYKAAKKFAPSLVTRWERYGQAKIALQVKSEDELLLLQAKALSLGVVAKVVHDAGRTQIVAGSATVCGIGPAPVSIVNEISGHLKLL